MCYGSVNSKTFGDVAKAIGSMNAPAANTSVIPQPINTYQSTADGSPLANAVAPMNQSSGKSIYSAMNAMNGQYQQGNNPQLNLATRAIRAAPSMRVIA
jgi:hypothetical protein